MSTSPLALAARGKGVPNLVKRIQAISQRYGATPTKMDQALAEFACVLQEFNCSATFPITAVALRRNGKVIEKYQELGIEFAIHGYTHIDYSQLTPTEQAEHLIRAKQVFAECGISASGFRCPYLRWNSDTLSALAQQDLSYDSSQALAWDVVDGCSTAAYERALDFYGARSAADYPALPRLEGGVVRIPYSVPDDEAIGDRLELRTPEERSALWLSILKRTHDLGELFTLGLHPERIELCRQPLADTLAAARELSPSVWIARLDQIAAWWRALSATTAEVSDSGDGHYRVTVSGPPGVTILVRAAATDVPTRPWANGYRQVDAHSFSVQADRRPFIGVSPGSSTKLVSFLNQQGYLVDIADDGGSNTVYLGQTDLAESEGRALLVRLEEEQAPLVRINRWPEGARSALAVTGDIDALTLWDYAIRFLGS